MMKFQPIGVVVVALGVFGSGCGQSDAQPLGAPVAPVMTEAPGRPDITSKPSATLEVSSFAEAVANGANPVAIELSQRMSRVQALAAACLAELGYENLPVHAPLVASDASMWFGPDDPTPPSSRPDDADWPSDPEFLRALNGSARESYELLSASGDVMGDISVPTGGCYGQSLATEFGSAASYADAVNVSNRVDDLVNLALSDVLASREYSSLHEQWTACLTSRGVSQAKTLTFAQAAASQDIGAAWGACREETQFLSTAAGLLQRELMATLSAHKEVVALIHLTPAS